MSTQPLQRKSDVIRSRRRSQAEFEALLAGANVEPEKRLAALLLFDSLAACRAGDGEACRWLQKCAPSYIEGLTKGDEGEQWIDKLALLIEGNQLSFLNVS